MKKLKSVLDTYNPLTVLITNMMGHSYQFDGMTLTDSRTEGLHVQAIHKIYTSSGQLRQEKTTEESGINAG